MITPPRPGQHRFRLRFLGGIRFAGLIGLMGLIGLLLGCGAEPDVAIPESSAPMELQSSAFEPNGTIPQKYTCDGQDLSPPLSWGTPPEGTQSLALIVDDPDAPRGTFVHWVAYNLSPDVQELPEGVASGDTLPGNGIQGQNDFNKVGFGGPCPPTGTHRYIFKLYALDTPLDLKPKASKADLVEALDGHILGYSELIGIYSRS